ncbi:MAG: hypothetical protein M9962_11115 [Oligoflexia bacterium]|nr:hypothetical protein [Oligoflexia bacterium]
MDLNFLSLEAQKLHAIFQNAFFTLLLSFFLIAIVIEFLKLPIGETPGFNILIGRALIATFLLISLPHIMNFIADTTDSISAEIGDLNNFKLVLSRLGEKLKEFSFSWTSLRNTITILLSFLSFLCLYVTVYFAEAAFLFCWTLIYVFSPLILSLYIFPQTAGATTAMFRSILEISMWKIVWACMSALLWSTAVSDINNPHSPANWLTSIVLNLMLMISILMTPKVVKAIFSGFSNLATETQGAIMGAASLTPQTALLKTKSAALNSARKVGGYALSKGRSFTRSQLTNHSIRKSAPGLSQNSKDRQYTPITPKNYKEVRDAFLAKQNKGNNRRL